GRMSTRSAGATRANRIGPAYSWNRSVRSSARPLALSARQRTWSSITALCIRSPAHRWAATVTAGCITGPLSWRGSQDEHTPSSDREGDGPRAGPAVALRHSGSRGAAGDRLRAGDRAAGGPVAEPGRGRPIHHGRGEHPGPDRGGRGTRG